MRAGLVLAAAIGITAAALAEPGRYVELEEFLAEVFVDVPDQRETLYLEAELRERIEAALGRRLPFVRVRYWRAGPTTAWVLDEIGKTEPITIGVSIVDGRVAGVRVLEFRESRGWEIRFPYFTSRYSGAALDAADRIDRQIDGITGATLSVAAVARAVRMALICDDWVRQREPASSS